MHIFLTGDKQIGKSTIINKTLERLKKANPKMVVGGFKTIAGNEEVFMHYLNSDKKFAIGKRKIGGYTRAFNTEGVRLLQNTENTNCDLIVMDEIGWMESNAEAFASEILKVLDGTVPVIGVIRKDCDTILISEIKRRADCEVIEVTIDNRDSIEI